jgi:hypothetical protein
MAWRDQYHHQAYAFVLQPEIVFQAQVNVIGYIGGPGGSAIIQTVQIKTPTITVGAIGDAKANMTMLLGSSQGASDLGRVRCWSDGTVDIIPVYCSPGTHDGELSATEDDWVTVIDDYRVWMKPPYVTNAGAYYYDGIPYPTGDETTGKVIDQAPIANAGPGYAQFIDSGTSLITVSFDGSGSFAVADDAVLGGYTADLFGGSEVLSASSGTPGNAIDSDTGTYWQPTTTAHEWIKVDWGSGNDQPIKKFTITGNSTNSPKQFALQWSDDNSNWVTAYYGIETGWGASEQRTFYNHYVKAHRYWRIFVHSNNTGASLRIAEWEMFAEDRTAGSSPYSWDVDDGTITVGTSASESMTATFPAGFRWVKLTVTDTNGEDTICYVPVAAMSNAIDELDYTSATISASNEAGGAAANAFDDNVLTEWATGATVTTGWLKCQFPEAKRVKSIGVHTYLPSYSPKDFTLQGSNDDSTYTTLLTASSETDWSTHETRTFTVDDPNEYLYYKLDITANNGGNHINLIELNLNGFEPRAAPVGAVEITRQALAPMGQVVDLAVHENLPETYYPDGTLVMIWEREVYAGSAGSLSAAGPSGREHMKFIGWIDTEPTDIQAREPDTLATTKLRCIDVGQRLTRLTGFPLAVERDAAPSHGYEMAHSNLDTFIYVFARWLSTASEVADFFWSYTADHYNIGVLATNGASLYAMINQRAAAMDHILTSNKNGQLQIIPDLLTCASPFSANASTKETLTAADYTRVRVERRRPPRVYWLNGSGVGFLPYDADHGSFAASAEFAISPGDVPGQGVRTSDDGEQVAPLSTLYTAAAYTTDVPERTGKRYAQDNAPNSMFDIELVHAGDTGIDPAEADWLKLTLPASVAAQRGLTVSAQQGVVRQLTIEHDHNAQTKTVRLKWEMQETSVDGWVEPQE